MARTARKTKRSLRPRPCEGPLVGPPDGYMDTLHERMEAYDASEPQIRALVQEFGLGVTMSVARQFYGHWEAAWEALEANRKALQVRRLGRTP